MDQRNSGETSATDPRSSIVYGEGLTGGFAYQRSRFIIEARSVVGRKQSRGGDKFSVYICEVSRYGALDLVTVTDQLNGTYVVEYVAPPGNYLIVVTLKGIQVKGSPSRSLIIPTEGATIQNTTTNAFIGRSSNERRDASTSPLPTFTPAVLTVASTASVSSLSRPVTPADSLMVHLSSSPGVPQHVSNGSTPRPSTAQRASPVPGFYRPTTVEMTSEPDNIINTQTTASASQSPTPNSIDSVGVDVNSHFPPPPTRTGFLSQSPTPHSVTDSLVVNRSSPPVSVSRGPTPNTIADSLAADRATPASSLSESPISSLSAPARSSPPAISSDAKVLDRNSATLKRVLPTVNHDMKSAKLTSTSVSVPAQRTIADSPGSTRHVTNIAAIDDGITNSPGSIRSQVQQQQQLASEPNVHLDSPGSISSYRNNHTNSPPLPPYNKNDNEESSTRLPTAKTNTGGTSSEYHRNAISPPLIDEEDSSTHHHPLKTSTLLKGSTILAPSHVVPQQSLSSSLSRSASYVAPSALVDSTNSLLLGRRGHTTSTMTSSALFSSSQSAFGTTTSTLATGLYPTTPSLSSTALPSTSTNIRSSSESPNLSASIESLDHLSNMLEKSQQDLQRLQAFYEPPTASTSEAQKTKPLPPPRREPAPKRTVLDQIQEFEKRLDHTRHQLVRLSKVASGGSTSSAKPPPLDIIDEHPSSPFPKSLLSTVRTTPKSVMDSPLSTSRPSKSVFSSPGSLSTSQHDEEETSPILGGRKKVAFSDGGLGFDEKLLNAALRRSATEEDIDRLLEQVDTLTEKWASALPDDISLSDITERDAM